jgi:hypothetical protein
MRLPIENWLEAQAVSDEVRALLQESATCFKTGAYRAALLFSYLTFQSVVRDRLAAAGPPAGVGQGEWESLHRNLLKEEAWDSTVYDAIQKKKGTTYFVITDDLRHQVEYWKNRRNDCAHFRANIIDAAHVEALWLFLRSNLARFVVNGSAQSLRAKIERFYDRSMTPAGQDPTPLVLEIPNAVPRQEVPAFLGEIREALSIPTLDGDYAFPKPELLEFFDAMLRHGSDVIRGALVKYFAADEGLALEVLRGYPHHVLYLAECSELIRRLWYTHLFADSRADYGLFLALLRNDLIDPADLGLASELAVQRVRNAIPEDECIDALGRAGFFRALEKHAFADNMINRFDWGNPNSTLIRWYVEKFPINGTVVSSISRNFMREPSAHRVRDALNDLFVRDAKKRQDFLAMAAGQSAELPALLPALSGGR